MLYSLKEQIYNIVKSIRCFKIYYQMTNTRVVIYIVFLIGTIIKKKTKKSYTLYVIVFFFHKKYIKLCLNTAENSGTMCVYRNITYPRTIGLENNMFEGVQG